MQDDTLSRLRVARVAAATLLLLSWSPAFAHAAGVREWLCAALELDCASSFTQDRGAACADWWGASLMTLDCSAARERELWNCEKCRSPLPLGTDRIAVIKPDGVWVWKAGSPPARAVAAAGLTALLGVASKPDRLLAVGGSPPKPVIFEIDLVSAAVAASENQPQTAEENGWVSAWLTSMRPAARHGDTVIEAIARGPATECGPTDLLTDRLGSVEGTDPFCPSWARSIEAADRSIRRDPAWLDTDRIIYVTAPAPRVRGVPE